MAKPCHAKKIVSSAFFHLTADLIHEYRSPGNQAWRETIMDYLKDRSALWWMMRILGGIGFAACLLLIIVLITLIG